MDLRSQVGACAEVLLNTDSTPAELSVSVQCLFDALERASCALDNQSSRLSHGKALSAVDAAQCLLDFQRTTQFLRGVDHALSEAARRWPQQPLRVLYAGCGPWAPLLLLLMPRWGERIAIHLVDAHAPSLRNALNLFAQIGADAFVAAADCADAASLILSLAQQPHVLVAEVMQGALAEESQVAITAQLAPQLLPGGILVPKRIVVRAVLACLADELHPLQPRARIELSSLIDVSLQSLPELQMAFAAQSTHLEGGWMTIPGLDATDQGVMLCTYIEVAEDIALGDYDSGITYPVMLYALGAARPGQRLAYRYRVGAHPGFECRWEDQSSSR